MKAQPATRFRDRESGTIEDSENLNNISLLTELSDSGHPPDSFYCVSPTYEFDVLFEGPHILPLCATWPTNVVRGEVPCCYLLGELITAFTFRLT